MVLPWYHQYHHSNIMVLLWHCHSTAQYHQVPQYHCSDTIMAPSVPSSTTVVLPKYTGTVMILPWCCHSPAGVGREILVTHQAGSLQDHRGTLKAAQGPRETEWQVLSGHHRRNQAGTSPLPPPPMCTAGAWGTHCRDQLELGARPPPHRILFSCWSTHEHPFAPAPCLPATPSLPTWAPPPRQSAYPFPRQPALPKGEKTVSLAQPI